MLERIHQLHAAARVVEQVVLQGTGCAAPPRCRPAPRRACGPAAGAALRRGLSSSSQNDHPATGSRSRGRRTRCSCRESHAAGGCGLVLGGVGIRGCGAFMASGAAAPGGVGSGRIATGKTSSGRGGMPNQGLSHRFQAGCQPTKQGYPAAMALTPGYPCGLPTAAPASWHLKTPWPPSASGCSTATAPFECDADP